MIRKNNFHQKENSKARFVLFIHHIYHILYTVNDLIVGIFFLAGDFLFFNPHMVFWGRVLFTLGSFLMLIRPLISFAHDVHIHFIQNKNIKRK